jgi:quercetin dioxygenase-like cupin family protein
VEEVNEVSATATPTLIAPDAGGVQLAFGRPMFQIGATQGSTGLGLIDVTLDPGGGFPFPHVHEDLEEAFYVLEGEVEFLLDDTWVRGWSGCTVFVPAGCVHAFRNASARPARQLVIGSSPDMLGLVKALGSSPRERWDDICADVRTRLVYGSRHFPPVSRSHT